MENSSDTGKCITITEKYTEDSGRRERTAVDQRISLPLRSKRMDKSEKQENREGKRNADTMMMDLMSLVAVKILGV